MIETPIPKLKSLGPLFFVAISLSTTRHSTPDTIQREEKPKTLLPKIIDKMLTEINVIPMILSISHLTFNGIKYPKTLTVKTVPITPNDVKTSFSTYSVSHTVCTRSRKANAKFALIKTLTLLLSFSLLHISFNPIPITKTEMIPEKNVNDKALFKNMHANDNKNIM